MGEILDVVDDEDNVLETARRSTIRKEALLHRVSAVIVVQKSGNFLVQKRSSRKDNHPSLWEIGCAETLLAGEPYEDGAVRGLKEELGIYVSQKQIRENFQFLHKYRSENHNVNYRVYKLLAGDYVKLQDEEVEEARFLSQDKVKEMMKKEPFTPMSLEIFQKYLNSKELGQTTQIEVLKSRGDLRI